MERVVTDAERVPVREVLVLRAEPERFAAMSQVGWDLMQATGATVVILRPGETLGTLDEEEMRAAGWVRAGV